MDHDKYLEPSEGTKKERRLVAISPSGEKLYADILSRPGMPTATYYPSELFDWPEDGIMKIADGYTLVPHTDLN